MQLSVAAILVKVTIDVACRTDSALVRLFDKFVFSGIDLGGRRLVFEQVYWHLEIVVIIGIALINESAASASTQDLSTGQGQGRERGHPHSLEGGRVGGQGAAIEQKLGLNMLGNAQLLVDLLLQLLYLAGLRGAHCDLSIHGRDIDKESHCLGRSLLLGCSLSLRGTSESSTTTFLGCLINA